MTHVRLDKSERVIHLQSAMSEGEQIPLPVARFIEARKGLHTEETIKNALNFKPGPSDVILSTALKSGTTVAQQICHGLRSGGDMNFDEICSVFPYLEGALDYGYKDLHAPQPYQPQMFKTHFWYHYTPRGAGKYITVVRKPADTAVSYFHFVEDWFTRKGEVSIEDLTEWVWLKRGAPRFAKDGCSTVHHIMSWYPHRLDKNVLWLHYEDINQNRRECVRLIAEFLDVEADEALLDLVTKQSSIEFMKKHFTKFDDHLVKLSRNEASGLDKNAGLAGNHGKVRTGQTNEGKNVLSSSILRKIDAQWTEVVTKVTGYKTYEEFRDGINKELNRSFE